MVLPPDEEVVEPPDEEVVELPASLAPPLPILPAPPRLPPWPGVPPPELEPPALVVLPPAAAPPATAPPAAAPPLPVFPPLPEPPSPPLGLFVHAAAKKARYTGNRTSARDRHTQTDVGLLFISEILKSIGQVLPVNPTPKRRCHLDGPGSRALRFSNRKGLCHFSGPSGTAYAAGIRALADIQVPQEPVDF
jgi:hypothetical protein